MTERNQLLRARGVGRRDSTRVDEEINGGSHLAMKSQGTNRSAEGGGGLLCDAGSKSRLGGREKTTAKIINGKNQFFV